jgi:integrase/recombinase XerD
VLRVKSLLGYAHKLGFALFNAGATFKVRSDSAHRGANIAKRIITCAEVGLLIRAAPSKRDRVLLEVTYAGGLRVSEIVALNWADVLPRDEGRVQLSITGKGGKVRQVLLPAIVSRSLLSLRGDAGANDPICVSRNGGRLSERMVNDMMKRAAKAAGINEAVSPALAAARAWFARHRARSQLARGSGDARPRQHRYDERVSARMARQL